MRSNARCYDKLREYIESVPLVDCHDHTGACGPKYTDPISVIINNYMHTEIASASSEADIAIIADSKRSVEERWPLLEKAWKRTCHTGYAQYVRRVLKKFYGESELTLAALKRMQPRLLNCEDTKLFESILDEAKILVRLEDMCGIDNECMSSVLNGTFKLSPRGKLVITLPRFHQVGRWDEIAANAAIVGTTVTSLDEYLYICRRIFDGYKKFGAIAFKDQSAYRRPINFDNPDRTEADRIFNWLMADPRRMAAFPDGVKPLGDYLFNEFMRMARDMDLPVQIHTGHMARIRDDITKTNAILLTKVLELHREVRFDLFHANWPYSGELLYLAKNYPNVTIDFCWANIIDPIYCQNMFRQVLSCVPHGKIHGYGSDFGGCPDMAWAHASIARDNIAIALADMVEMEYLGLDDAKEVAYAWLFGNANVFFRLDIKA